MNIHRTALALVALVALAAAGRAGAQEATATYVGDETCTSCHDDKAGPLAATPHGGPAFAAKSPHGCETCHGAGSRHVENPDDEALRPRIETRSAEAQSAVCQQCHDGGQQFLWRGSAHASRGLACESCHSIHGAKSEHGQLKAATQLEQCLSCHKDVRAELWKNSHHPIREGKLVCADCHNPHGSQTAKLLRASSVNELCYTCHAEKRGPMLYEHPPVRENCLNCHAPHGSNHTKLQQTSVPYICQQCHANTRHPGTLYDNTTLADASRASNRIFNRACLNCHAAIHGSNNPSSPFLGH